MKKIYLFLLLAISSVSFGQATDLYFSKYGEGSSNNKFLEVYNGTGSDVDMAAGVYSIEMYANGASAPTNTQVLSGTITAGDVYVLRNGSAALPAITSAADITSSVCNYNGDDAVVLKKNGVIIDMIGQVGNDPGTGWAVAGTTTGTLDHTLVRKTTVCSPNPNPLGSFGTDANNSEWTVEAIDYTAGLGSFNGCNTSPDIVITSPSNGITYSPETTSVDITLLVSNFNVANGTGDGHIHYTINGGSVVMKYDTTPIVVPTTPGTYTIYVELVNNSHNPIVPAQNATVTFTVGSYNVVANLAALRADVIANGAGKYYQVSSSPIITYARTNRNQKYVQDASAGILIDDLAGKITTTMVNGDAMSGLKGLTSLFSGVLQLLPTTNATIASSGNTVTPQVVTAADITANIEAYESELVRINNATFTTADGTLAFATNNNYNLNDGGSDIVFRTLFSEADYIGQTVPTGTANRVVLVAEFNGTAQVVARSLSDVTLSRNSVNDISGLKVYPNPAKNTLYVTSDSFAAKQVELFDVLGKSVLNTKVVNNTVNISSLSKGVYVAKITEEGKTATRKVVIE